MTKETSSKIQQLLTLYPSGVVVTSAAVKEKGYSDELLHHYRQSGWLVALGRGAFVKAGDVIDWKGGLYALQDQLKLPVHLGGKSALAYLGAVHFLKLGATDVVNLFGTPGTRLPSWFTQYKWKAKITFTTTNLFPNDTGLTLENVGNFSIKLASRERAMLETLYLAPKKQSLSEVRLLMAGLTNLRPQLLQKLLESCASVKVKRLFMVFAEELNLPWVKKLETNKIDFGSGDRTIEKGGKLHSKYRVTLPAGLFEEYRI